MWEEVKGPPLLHCIVSSVTALTRQGSLWIPEASWAPSRSLCDVRTRMDRFPTRPSGKQTGGPAWLELLTPLAPCTPFAPWEKVLAALVGWLPGSACGGQEVSLRPGAVAAAHFPRSHHRPAQPPRSRPHLLPPVRLFIPCFALAVDFNPI